MPDTAKISWKTAAGLVMANMIGTGVFTSLGFQLLQVQNTWSIILLWVIGGIMALIGALIYAELGTHFKKSGGDYIFLSETLHPSIGYLYAWVSLTVGFSAPIAIAAMAMNNYLNPIIRAGIYPGLAFLLFIPLTHIFSIKRSSQFQNLFTLIKILFILGLIGIGLSLSNQISTSALDFSGTWKNEVFLPGFAVSLVYVFYAYTGWNSAAYIVEEIENPEKNLPKALLAATSLVLVLYVLMQLVFLKHANQEQLLGQVEVAEISFKNIFGESGAMWVSILIGIQLIATISGYAWVGPRVTYAMAKDFKIWKPLSKTNSKGIPVRAILINTFFSLILFLSGSFEQVMIYAGFILQIMGTITVYSSLKVSKSKGFRSPFKPLLQYCYIVFSLFVSGYIFWEKPKESLAGLILILAGLILYKVDKKTGTRPVIDQ
ncbi:amino acid permease [Algoriphagus sp. NBT04N3]|jgi:basic amino acid/polyamine antiporter, APA family|uniref:APC family permease n=1 Tax=Algoriphagus sp. NBT04N3 TaxID=2705473 RepID=UPI001C62DCB1|nr:amino acid permease [Algoriphagus sp. NBT04N3]QYH38689.1 amino acid permease [Algoriphagus sp. NBT04N3]